MRTLYAAHPRQGRLRVKGVWVDRGSLLVRLWAGSKNSLRGGSTERESEVNPGLSEKNERLKGHFRRAYNVVSLDGYQRELVDDRLRTAPIRRSFP